MPPAQASRLHVAVAAIVRADGRILMTCRQPHAHQGGLWEFPGGKLEGGENVSDALARELSEELGVIPRRARPLIRAVYDYPDKRVLLDTWRVDGIAGDPRPREGQPMRWVSLPELLTLALPPANAALVTALSLPDRVTIVPVTGDRARLPPGWQPPERGLLLLEARGATNAQYLALAEQLLATPGLNPQRLVLERAQASAAALAAIGTWHCTADNDEPGAGIGRLCMSIAGASDLARLARVTPDFVLLTVDAHTENAPGRWHWHAFRELVQRIGVPVYARGVTSGDLYDAYASGAQGIALEAGD